MSKLKTIAEWLDQLRPDIQEKALKNLNSASNANGDDCSQLLRESLDHALMSAFRFSRSIEGFDFWMNIIDSTFCGSTEFLKPAEQ